MNQSRSWTSDPSIHSYWLTSAPAPHTCHLHLVLMFFLSCFTSTFISVSNSSGYSLYITPHHINHVYTSGYSSPTSLPTSPSSLSNYKRETRTLFYHTSESGPSKSRTRVGYEVCESTTSRHVPEEQAGTTLETTRPALPVMYDEIPLPPKQVPGSPSVFIIPKEIISTLLSGDREQLEF